MALPSGASSKEELLVISGSTVTQSDHQARKAELPSKVAPLLLQEVVEEAQR